MQTKANFGGLDILISMAAVNPAVGHVLDNTEEVWDKIFDVNLKSTFLLMKESLPLLNKSVSPSIITMSSIAAYKYSYVSLFQKKNFDFYVFYLLKEHFAVDKMFYDLYFLCFFFKSLGIYSISKTALLSLTRVTAMELAPQGIRVNCIAPGIIKTKFSKQVFCHCLSRVQFVVLLKDNLSLFH